MKYIHIYTVIVLLFCVSSCERFLEEEHETSFTNSSLFETVEGLERMVVGLHNQERTLSQKPDANGLLAAQIWGERTTDIVVFTTGGDASLGRYTDAGASGHADKTLYKPYWEHKYYMIGRANEIIYYGKLLGEEAKKVVAEGSFWRAYSYYSLWVRFGAVYLTTEPVTPDNVFNLAYKKADPKDLFLLLNSDLDTAIAGLPEENPKNGRLFKNTARHLKALVAAWEKDWDTVLKMTEDIEKSQQSRFSSDVSSLFNSSDLTGKDESLFVMPYSMERGGGAGHRLGEQNINVSYELAYTTMTTLGTDDSADIKYNDENMGQNWGLAFPNSYLLSLYPVGDKRLDVFFKINYRHRNEKLLDKEKLKVKPRELMTDKETGREYYSTTNTTDSPKLIQVGDIISGRDLLSAGKGRPAFRQIVPSSIKQYDKWDKPLDGRGAIARNDIIIFRLSETYLLAAEAALAKNDQPTAVKYYNKTWERAGNTPVDHVTFDMIRDEQARELNFEGRRWDFLKRNGIWYKQMISYAGDFTKYPNTKNVPGFDKTKYGITDERDSDFGPNPDYYADFNGTDNDVLVRFNVRPFHVNWAVPQSQIEVMGADFPQNEGY